MSDSLGSSLAAGAAAAAAAALVVVLVVVLVAAFLLEVASVATAVWVSEVRMNMTKQ
jgi:hypothetical protein